LSQSLSNATDAVMDTICLMTGARYLEFGLELGFSEEEIDIFDSDKRKCQLITSKILKSWIKRQGSKAT